MCSSRPTASIVWSGVSGAGGPTITAVLTAGDPLEVALSALPQRVFRVLSRAQETIGAMVEKPRPLTDEDRQRLMRMRSLIDTLLEQRKG